MRTKSLSAAAAERRLVSLQNLVDRATHAIQRVMRSPDPFARSNAEQALTALLRLREEMPHRRWDDCEDEAETEPAVAANDRTMLRLN